jgi:hypothetical protein
MMVLPLAFRNHTQASIVFLGGVSRALTLFHHKNSLSLILHKYRELILMMLRLGPIATGLGHARYQCKVETSTAASLVIAHALMLQMQAIGNGDTRTH